MDTKEIKSKNVFKKINLVDLVYLSVILIFFIIVIVLFFYSTKLIVQNVNKIFIQTNEVDSHALNIENYTLVEKKLNLPINNTSNQVASSPATSVVNNTSTPAVVVTPKVIVPILNNKSLSINVLNGSRKAGVASDMVAKLETAGFSKGTVGDSKTIYPITTILIKDTKKDYTKVVENIVKKSYPNAITKVNPNTSSFDVIIIVGKK